MMLTKVETEFIQRHKETLGRLFRKRIEELKEDVLVAKPEDRNRIIDLIAEFKKWLVDIEIFSKEIKVEKDNYI